MELAKRSPPLNFGVGAIFFYNILVKMKQKFQVGYCTTQKEGEESYATKLLCPTLDAGVNCSICLCVLLVTVNAQILEVESTPETPFIHIYISNVNPTVGQRSAYRGPTLWVGSSGIRARHRQEDFLFQNVQIGSGANAGSYSICTVVLPRGREAGA